MNFLLILVVALLKPLYYRFAAAMLRDTTWQEPLFDLISPKQEGRLLAFGPGSAATAISLAERFAELRIVVADSHPAVVRRSKRAIEKGRISNITFIDAPSIVALPVHAGSFDRAICVLSFHLRSSDEKTAWRGRRSGSFAVEDCSTSRITTGRPAARNASFSTSRRWYRAGLRFAPTSTARGSISSRRRALLAAKRSRRIPSGSGGLRCCRSGSHERPSGLTCRKPPACRGGSDRAFVQPERLECPPSSAPS